MKKNLAYTIIALGIVLALIFVGIASYESGQAYGDFRGSKTITDCVDKCSREANQTHMIYNKACYNVCIGRYGSSYYYRPPVPFPFYW